jgi:hypothetical protein
MCTWARADGSGGARGGLQTLGVLGTYLLRVHLCVCVCVCVCVCACVLVCFLGQFLG